MAVATRAVLQMKYVVAAPTSGFGMSKKENTCCGGVPPSHVYTSPAAFTVTTSEAMLKSVLYSGDRDCVRKVHWLHALAAATSIVSFAPSISSAAKSTAYDTDIVEPLVASGSLTFRADASDEQPSRIANRSGFAIECGANIPRTIAPAASTAPTKRRAPTGRSFIDSGWGEPKA